MDLGACGGAVVSMARANISDFKLYFSLFLLHYRETTSNVSLHVFLKSGYQKSNRILRAVSMAARLPNRDFQPIS